MAAANSLARAKTYLRRGWSLVPAEAGGKRPLVRWEPYQERRPTEAELGRWFKRWPDANIAVVTGALSGLIVLDVDPRHGGGDSLAALERRHGALPETVEAISGGGGRHIYFSHPGGTVHNRVGLLPGIDLRGDGGVIIVPPSLHPSGRHYEWKVSHHPEDLDPVPLPPWLLTLLKGAGGHPGHPAAFWRGLIRGGVAEGQRNNSIASITGHLLWRGVDPVVIKELLLCWNRVRCRPPLPDDEVAWTVDSIRRTHERHTRQEEGH